MIWVGSVQRQETCISFYDDTNMDYNFHAEQRIKGRSSQFRFESGQCANPRRASVTREGENQIATSVERAPQRLFDEVENV